MSTELYLPTTLDSVIRLKARDLNRNLDKNIVREIERKYGGTFRQAGYVRPGSIKLISRGLTNKVNSSDLGGDVYCSVNFKCEVYLPRTGQEVMIKLKSINKVGALGEAENNKLMVMLTKKHQVSAPELLSQVLPGQRVIVKIIHFKVNSHNETIVAIGDLTQIIEGVYQNYLLPEIIGLNPDIQGDIERTSNIQAIYSNLDVVTQSINYKCLIDPYDMYRPDGMSNKEWESLKSKPAWKDFKNYWQLAKYAVEDYELVHPTGGYNNNVGVAVTPFGSRPITRAYYKMWEILHRYPDILYKIGSLETGLTVLALGEGPGGFMQAVSHVLMKQGRPKNAFYGYTIETKRRDLRWDNPVAEKERAALNQDFHLKYGDLTASSTLKQILKDLKGQEVDLVVADGAIEGTNQIYNYEEPANFHLFYGEIAAALMTQKIGGSFVIKIFDILTHVTQQLLILLNHYYSEVFVTKPDFSRPASSEKYLVCLGFRGLATEDQIEAEARDILIEIMEALEKEPLDLSIHFSKHDRFLRRLLGYNLDNEDQLSSKINEINLDHVSRQCNHISAGVHLIHTRSLSNTARMSQLKQRQLQNAVQWCTKYELDYKDDIVLSTENAAESSVVNTSGALNFSVKSVNKDEAETYKYLKNNYSQLTLEYMRDRFVGVDDSCYELYCDEISREKTTYKRQLLDPLFSNPVEDLRNLQSQVDYLSPDWFSAYELATLFKLGKGDKGAYRAFFQDVLPDGEFLFAVNHYITGVAGRTLTWFGNSPLSGNRPMYDPYGLYDKFSKHWLMGADKHTGDVTKLSTLRAIEKHFAKEPVDLYVASPKVNNKTKDSQVGRQYLGQLYAGLVSLKSGGTFIIRQHGFMTPMLASLISLLTELFADVRLVKPLASPAETYEVYLVGLNFKPNNLTKSIKTDLLDYLEDFPNEIDDEVPVEPFTKAKVSADLEQNLVYIGYRIYTLNTIPMLQILMDLSKNPKYRLNNVQETEYEILINKKQAVQTRIKADPSQETELSKVNLQIQTLFKDINRRIVHEDFSWLIEGIAKNWPKQNPVPKLTSSQKLK